LETIHKAAVGAAELEECGRRQASVDTQNRQLIDTSKPAIN
jgi:hypothetical protein